MSIASSNLKLVHDAAWSTLLNLQKMPDHPRHRNGGYLTLMRDWGLIEAVLLVGKCDLASAEKYYELSLEKASRLFLNEAHRSSHESRNEKNQMYRGAVRARNSSLILSFSGCTENEDEVISLMSAIELESMDVAEAREIAAISDNALFVRYLAEYGHEHDIE